MSAVKCPNCRLSLPPNWAGVNDPNGKCPYCGKPLSTNTQPASGNPDPAAVPAAATTAKVQSAASKTILWGVGAPMPVIIKPPAPIPQRERTPVMVAHVPTRATGHAPAIAPQATATGPTDGFAATVEMSALKRENLVAHTPAPQPQPQPGSMIDVDVAMDAGPTKPEPAAPTNSAPQADSAAPALAVLAASQELSLSDVLQDKSNPVKRGRPAATPVQVPATDDLDDQPGKSKKGLVIGLILLAAAAGGVVYLVLGRSGGGEATKEKVEEKTVAAKPIAPVEPVAAPKAIVPIAEVPVKVEAKPAKPVAEAKPAPAPKPAKPVAEAKPAPAHKPAVTETAKPSAKVNEDKTQQAAEAYKRGNANLFQGKLAEAITNFNEALKLNPKDPSPHRGLGLALGQQGKSPEAVKHLKLYLKASPKAQDRQTIEKRIEMLSAK